MTRKPIPESLLRKLRKAGKARAAQITTEERKRFGRKAWQTRLAKATKS